MKDGIISEGAYDGVSDMLARPTPVVGSITHPGPNPGWKDYEFGRPAPVVGPVVVSSSTTLDKTPELEIGEEWYIRFPGARALSHVIIADVTVKTVLVKSASFYDNNGSRYEKKDIDFIERCKAVEPKATTSE